MRRAPTKTQQVYHWWARNAFGGKDCALERDPGGFGEVFRPFSDAPYDSLSMLLKIWGPHSHCSPSRLWEAGRSSRLIVFTRGTALPAGRYHASWSGTNEGTRLLRLHGRGESFAAGPCESGKS